MSNKISRKDFLSVSALMGAGALIGSSSVLTSCGEKAPQYTPLKQPGEYYIPKAPSKEMEG